MANKEEERLEAVRHGIKEETKKRKKQGLGFRHAKYEQGAETRDEKVARYQAHLRELGQESNADLAKRYGLTESLARDPLLSTAYASYKAEDLRGKAMGTGYTPQTELKPKKKN